MENVVIVSAVRTPFDKFGGVMKNENTVALGSFVVKEAMERAAVDPAEVEETYIGSSTARRPASTSRAMQRAARAISHRDE